jgi:hypothetical protein
MLVQMKNGNVEEVTAEAAAMLIRQGRAERIHSEESYEAMTLSAESHGGPAACVGIEMATLEPKSEHAVVRFVRTARSKLGV